MDKFSINLTRLFKLGECAIDSFVFRLHYRFTLFTLIAFSIAVTGRQYLGDPIDCISKDDIPHELLDNYCWISTTFSVESAWFKEIGKEIPYPGVDKYTPGEKRVYHAYYQWVCFMLFLQAMLFYIPWYLWKNIESHKMRNLAMEFGSAVVSAGGVYDEEEKKFKPNEKTKVLVNYLFESKGSHYYYAISFYMAHVLNFANVVGQIFLMDTFLGGEFTTYGTKVLSFSGWDYSLRYDPMIRVFPRMTKCTFHRYGSSGDVQKHDAMCLIPINILNEKIYIFLWFWFIILSCLSGMEVLYRAFGLFFSDFRYAILRFKCRKVLEKDLDRVLGFLDRYDWQILCMLCNNTTPCNFKIIMHDLAEKIKEEAPPKKIKEPARKVEVESLDEKQSETQPLYQKNK